jgi:hypothetical protein
MKMKMLKGLRIVALAGLIMFLSQLGHVAHAGLFGGVTGTVSMSATSSSTTGGISGTIGSTIGSVFATAADDPTPIGCIPGTSGDDCYGLEVTERPVEVTKTCELANGAVFTITFVDNEEGAAEFDETCETAQLQLLWYHNLALWTSASCDN